LIAFQGDPDSPRPSCDYFFLSCIYIASRVLPSSTSSKTIRYAFIRSRRRSFQYESHWSVSIFNPPADGATMCRYFSIRPSRVDVHTRTSFCVLIDIVNYFCGGEEGQYKSTGCRGGFNEFVINSIRRRCHVLCDSLETLHRQEVLYRGVSACEIFSVFSFKNSQNVTISIARIFALKMYTLQQDFGIWTVFAFLLYRFDYKNLSHTPSWKKLHVAFI